MLRPGRKFYKRPSVIVIVILLLVALFVIPIGCVFTNKSETKTVANLDKNYNPLYIAVEAGDLDEVKRLIAEGADINDTNGGKTLTPLGEAAFKGNAEIVKVLLENGADVEKADYFSPLFYAIWSHDQATVKTLIDAGANVNLLPSEFDSTPISYAIWEEKSDIVENLIDAGADLNIHIDGSTPLYHAKGSSKEMFDLILNKGNYPESIHLAVCKGDLNKVKILITEGVDIDTPDEFGCTPLNWAASRNYIEIVDYLITQGADVNKADNLGYTPLMCANGLAVVKSLVTHGADIHMKSPPFGWTKLQSIVSAGKVDIADYILSQGENIHQLGRGSESLLGIAVSREKKDMVEFLISKGIDINSADYKGLTPLDVAKKGKFPEIIDILRQHGAKETLFGAVDMSDVNEVKRLIDSGIQIDTRNTSGQTHLHFASAQGRVEIVKLLIDAGANIKAKAYDYDGFTPLHEAAKEGHKDVVELLIAKGADVNVPNYDAITPLKIAQENGHTEIVELLKQHGAKE